MPMVVWTRHRVAIVGEFNALPFSESFRVELRSLLYDKLVPDRHKRAVSLKISQTCNAAILYLVR